MSMNVEVVNGAKFLHRGALNLPAALFLQTKRFDPLPSPPYAGLNFGCGGRSGLPSCRRRRLVSEAAAVAAAAMPVAGQLLNYPI